MSVFDLAASAEGVSEVVVFGAAVSGVVVSEDDPGGLTSEDWIAGFVLGMGVTSNLSLIEVTMPS